ncbi:MAG: RsmE family RNA methyltransferase [Verrucomicrobiota bacterium]
MNLLLFEEPFEEIGLRGDDPRAKHLLEIVKVKAGALIFVGFFNGLRARAKVAKVRSDGSISLQVVGSEPSPELLPISLLVGLPRPHTAKRILFDAASMGVKRIHFFETEKGEPSYAQSSLWRTDEWKRRIQLGVEQSFATCIPDVAIYPDLQTALSAFGQESLRILLDNYEASGPLNELLATELASVVLAVGPERGWSDQERMVFRQNGWSVAHLGEHVLRAETAVVASVSAVASGLGFWKKQTQTKLS